MKNKVLILDQAKVDVKEAKHYYKNILSSLSKRFIVDLESTVKRISNNPYTFGKRFKNFRTANLSVFPFQVHYTIDEEKNVVIIFAILHAYRDPNYITIRSNKSGT